MTIHSILQIVLYLSFIRPTLIFSRQILEILMVDVNSIIYIVLTSVIAAITTSRVFKGRKFNMVSVSFSLARIVKSPELIVGLVLTCIVLSIKFWSLTILLSYATGILTFIMLKLLLENKYPRILDILIWLSWPMVVIVLHHILSMRRKI